MKTFSIITFLILVTTFSHVSASEQDHNRGLSGINNGTHDWKTFVIHIREGEVDELTQAPTCQGRDQNGEKHTNGCARWRHTPPGALIDGECWITVPKWDITNLFGILYTWGHELGHCVKGRWHK